MEVKRQNLATQGGPASAVAAAVSAAVLLGGFAGVILDFKDGSRHETALQSTKTGFDPIFGQEISRRIRW